MSVYRKEIFLVASVILFSTLIRFYNINGAMFDFNPCRQAATAAIARNYVQDQDPRFLLPKVDNEGSNPGYFMFEFPVLAFATSLLIKVFGQHNWVFRIIPILLFALSGALFYILCRHVVGARTALISLIFYSIAPMSILMSRVIQSESFMMVFLFITIYCAIRWLEEEKVGWLLGCVSALTGLILLKITNVYLFILLGALFLIYKKPKMIFAFILAALPALAINFWWWIAYSSEVRAMYHTDYTYVGNVPIFTLSYVLGDISRNSFSASYWLMTLKHCVWIVFSPIIFFLSALGLFVKKPRGVSFFLAAWVAAVLFFVFAVPSAGSQDYYKIHFIPPGAVLAAISCLWVYDRMKEGIPRIFVVSVFWAFTALSVFVIVYPMIRYKTIFHEQEILGKKVEAMSNKNDLVMACFGPDPMLLYYCNRKGWSAYLPLKEDNIGLIERKKAEGAKFFVCGSMEEFEADPAFKGYMYGNYRLVDSGRAERLEPERNSLDHFFWTLFGKTDTGVAGKFQRVKPGYVIFDLEKKK